MMVLRDDLILSSELFLCGFVGILPKCIKIIYL